MGTCRQPFPMSNASGMLHILDLVSLARLTIVSGKVWDKGKYFPDKSLFFV